MKLPLTRAIVAAIYSGELAQAPTQTDPVFGIDVATKCPGVPDEVLLPRQTWASPTAYDAAAQRLAALFQDNFAAYREGVNREVLAAGPQV